MLLTADGHRPILRRVVLIMVLWRIRVRKTMIRWLCTSRVILELWVSMGFQA